VDDWQQVHDIDAFEREQTAFAILEMFRSIESMPEGEHRRVCQIGFYKAVAAIDAHVKGEMDKARASLAARH
jgi:hypothetical protein